MTGSFLFCNVVMAAVVFRSYSYKIEVSMNKEDWKDLVDYSSMLCRSWQYLRFKERVVK